MTPKIEEIIAGNDYKGQTLCVNCWNGNHYFKWEMTREVGRTEPVKRIVQKPKGAGVMSNCLQGMCQCHCIDLMHEKHSLPKRDKDNNLELF